MYRQLELCVESLQACQAASACGADRIELCAALAEGGVTPSRGFVEAALTVSTVPVHVLIRPRSGNFFYSEREFQILCADLDTALAAGAAGVVAGVLTADHEIDRLRTAELVRLAGGRPVTFHRAFDMTRDPMDSLRALLDLGCDRILTSGGKPTVLEGLDTLTELARMAAGRIRIAAGGGVTLANASTFVGVPGLDVHASLRIKPDALTTDPLWQQDALCGAISEDAVRELSRIVHATSLSQTRA